MFHGYHATIVMHEHHRRVRAVTAHAHRHPDDAVRSLRRARRPWWRRRGVAAAPSGVEVQPQYDLAPSTR